MGYPSRQISMRRQSMRIIVGALDCTQCFCKNLRKKEILELCILWSFDLLLEQYKGSPKGCSTWGGLCNSPTQVNFRQMDVFFPIKPFFSCFLIRVQSSTEALLSLPVIFKNECLTLQRSPMTAKIKLKSRQKLIKSFSWAHRAHIIIHTFVMLSFSTFRLSFSSEPVFVTVVGSHTLGFFA